MSNEISVYISYARSKTDNPHKEKLLLDLVNRLKKDDMNVEIDFYIKDTCKNFFYWMNNCLDNADFILLICDEDFYMKYTNPSEDYGLGVAHEISKINVLHYKNNENSGKIIPILLNPEDSKYIPDTFYFINNKVLYDINGNWQENEYKSLHKIITYKIKSFHHKIHQIFQTQKFSILKNSANDLMILIEDTGHEQNNPIIFYDGNKYALFVNNGIYILDYIHPEIRGNLYDAKKILIVEASGQSIIREYFVKIKKNNLKFFFSVIKPMVPE